MYVYIYIYIYMYIYLFHYVTGLTEKNKEKRVV